MPKQKGTHRLLGTTGDMTYQKTKDGYSAREKTHISGDKIRTSDAYARTRENMAEFGRAGKASKLFRAAFAKLIKGGSDTRVTSRLTGNFSRVIKTDPVNDRGLRTVTDGDIMLMEGFDFNIDSALFTTFVAPFQTSIDRATGECTVFIPPVVLTDVLKSPEGSTHMRIVTAAAAVDFEGQQYVSAYQDSSYLLISNLATAPITLTTQLPVQSPDPLFLIMGVQFTQIVNGKPYAFNNGSFNALTLIKVDPAA